ncbi:DUF2100 domain-containing protein [Methanobacterium aggregans]|uniref:DUF2100 domain-containing protein n=1 Tax=Methanobacterium aggregans TaxID=1615586 RepID=UPI001AE5A88B|nr:DUF2100 domain-containing protein [Methanobacterium aggregans]MBP2046317.1 hypothetical protein [Methanobacterium aggregans]
MEKFRLEQTQALLEKAGKSRNPAVKFKTPKEGRINSELFGKTLNELFEAEEFIYTSRPSHVLNAEDAQTFCSKIIAVRGNLDEMLADFGVIERENREDEIKKLSENFLIITTKSNFKKALTKLGVDAQHIIVAGVPLEAEDMKLINPKIPDAALKGVGKKIEHVKNDIKRKTEQFNPTDILVVVEMDRTGEVLGKRAHEIYGAKVITMRNLKDVTAEEFRAKLSQ